MVVASGSFMIADISLQLVDEDDNCSEKDLQLLEGMVAVSA